ncbi:ABC transporter substrate-binding protein [Streptomyces sp. NPDC059009]|uniref:ABC transporter substrate-binding protein n=1 Tax=Streptomyces sp. NPDC059009 TaxID=3346694 RepID=UPI0036905B04
MIRRRTALLAAVPLFPLLAACQGGTKDAVAPSMVRIAHLPSTLFAPLYLADAKGYFKQEGITVELQKVKSGQDAVPLAAAGKIDAVVAGFSAGLFNGVAKGLGVKVLASMGAATGETPSPTALEVAKRLLDSKDVDDPADLRGRKIAVAGGAGAAGGYQLAETLRASGLGLKDVRVVNVAVPDMKAALADGGVDAAVVPAPFTTAMEQGGVAEPVAVPPRGTTATGVIVGDGFAAGPAAGKLLAALRKAAADLQGRGRTSEETLTVLARATGQQVDVLRRTPAYEWDPRLAPNTGQLKKMQAAYREAGLLRGGPVAMDQLVK